MTDAGSVACHRSETGFVGLPGNGQLEDTIGQANKKKTGCRGRSKLAETRVLRVTNTVPALGMTGDGG